jgi:hypothetical protein
VKVGVLCAVSARRIAGPVFFNKTIVKDMYRSFSKVTEEESLWMLSGRLSYCSHCTYCMSMQALSGVFGDRIISSGIWPAHSPDLNPCDFFFWDCLSDKVYNSNPEQKI